MPVIAGFDQLASVPEEQITEKIRRRVVSGKQGTMDFRIGDEKRTMKPGDVAVIPGGVEHEGYFLEDSEAIDFFAPVREDFLTSACPSYMVER